MHSDRTISFKYYWYSKIEKLENGEYRIKKEAYDNEISVEFIIDNSIN